MKNLLINSKNIIINGRLFCSGEVTFSERLPENVVFDKAINSDIIIRGNLFVDGKIYIILLNPISSYADNIISNEDVFYNITKDIIQPELFVRYDLKEFKKIKSENIYIFANNIRVGNDIVSNFDEKDNNKQRIYLSKILNKIKTKQNLSNTNK
jgi:hypothetical protein